MCDFSPPSRAGQDGPQDDRVVHLLLASMSLSRGAVSEEDSCSLTLAMSLGWR